MNAATQNQSGVFGEPKNLKQEVKHFLEVHFVVDFDFVCCVRDDAIVVAIDFGASSLAWQSERKRLRHVHLEYSAASQQS